MYDENVVKSEIEQGMAQVDDTLTIIEFVCDYDKTTRALKVFYTAQSADGETVEGSNIWD